MQFVTTWLDDEYLIVNLRYENSPPPSSKKDKEKKAASVLFLH